MIPDSSGIGMSKCKFKITFSMNLPALYFENWLRHVSSYLTLLAAEGWCVIINVLAATSMRKGETPPKGGRYVRVRNPRPSVVSDVLVLHTRNVKPQRGSFRQELGTWTRIFLFSIERSFSCSSVSKSSWLSERSYSWAWKQPPASSRLRRFIHLRST